MAAQGQTYCDVNSHAKRGAGLAEPMAAQGQICCDTR